MPRMIHRRGSDSQRAFVPLDLPEKTPGSEFLEAHVETTSIAAVNEIESLG
ncbi:MAG: hypothetical protein U0872_14085 [Planctomycetaceae bacterium]